MRARLWPDATHCCHLVVGNSPRWGHGEPSNDRRAVRTTLSPSPIWQPRLPSASVRLAVSAWGVRGFFRVGIVLCLPSQHRAWRRRWALSVVRTRGPRKSERGSREREHAWSCHRPSSSHRSTAILAEVIKRAAAAIQTPAICHALARGRRVHRQRPQTIHTDNLDETEDRIP